MILYNSNDGTPAEWRNVDGATDLTVAIAGTGHSGLTVAVTSSVDGDLMTGHWTAESPIA